jgi:RNA polymerase sigma factor (sigma-70 family)
MSVAPVAAGIRLVAQSSPDGDRADAAAAAAGDSAAYERLYRRHVGRIWTLASRIVGADEADDATQEIFVRAWQKLDRFRGESSFGTWLYRLGVNVLLGRRSADATRHARIVSDEPAIARHATAPVRVDLRMDMDAALERLPHGARQVFVLHDVEGYTHEEIGELLEVTTGTSKSQLHRARMALRTYLEPDGRHA